MPTLQIESADLDLFSADFDTEAEEADGDEEETAWLEMAADEYALPFEMPEFSLTPRPYQKEALTAWGKARGRGVVVLPTGADKTVVAFMVLEAMRVRTLVVVPTIDLMHQWHDGIREKFGLGAVEVGMIGGGFQAERPITIIT